MLGPTDGQLKIGVYLPILTSDRYHKSPRPMYTNLVDNQYNHNRDIHTFHRIELVKLSRVDSEYIEVCQLAIHC